MFKSIIAIFDEPKAVKSDHATLSEAVDHCVDLFNDSKVRAVTVVKMNGTPVFYWNKIKPVETWINQPEITG